MSRITEAECSCMDMEWYAIDKNGNIAVFCSAGCGNIPEFVCENVERAYELMEYFGQCNVFSDIILYYDMNEDAKKIAKEFSQKGIFYYDSDDFTQKDLCNLHEYYTLSAAPKNPLKIENLPENIYKLIKCNLIEIENFVENKRIDIKHAY